MRWAVLVFAAASSTDITATVPEGARVVVSYQAPSAVTLHEPMIVVVHLKNESAGTVHFDLGFNRQAGFALRIKSPDGSVHTPRIVERDVGRVGRLVLRPNDESSHQLLLNDWLRFDQVGPYEIAIQLVEPIRTESGEAIKTLTATQFRLRVVPHDPLTLQRVCRRLADTIMRSERAEDRQNAARSLSHVAHPEVLPFVKEILAAASAQDSILVEGLMRVNHAEAEVILLEMAYSKNAERAALGRNALQRIAGAPR